MKRQTSLSSLTWKRENRWADFRDMEREKAGDRVAGLKMRDRDHIVQLYDWSEGGTCIDLPGAAKIGERVQIVFGTQQRAGRVCWIVDGRAGVEFTD